MADPTLDAYASRANLAPFTEADHPSTWGDTVAASFALTRREEITSSAFNAWEKKIADRAKVIKELGGDESIALEYPTEGRRRSREQYLERGGLSSAYNPGKPSLEDAEAYVNGFVQKYPDKVLDDRALAEQMRQELAVERMRDQDIMNRGGGGAAFLGTAGAVFTDPIVLATAPIGGDAAAGKNLLTTIGKAALAEGTVAAVTEIPVQAQVYQFKKDIESPWGFADSAVNVLAAGVGGAAFGGGIAGGKVGYKKALEKYRAWKGTAGAAPTPEMNAAEDALAQAVSAQEQNPLRADIGGEELAAETHVRALETAQEQLDAGEPVDVSHVVSGLEAPDPIGEVHTRAQDPAALVDVDPLKLQVDAKTFQFKGGGDAEGVTSSLRDVDRFDRRLAGVALIWERADGQQFIADGHQRVALARRAIAAGQDPAEVRLNGFVLREADGVTAVDARRMAAVKNMAEGSGSALDAAKILRDVGPVGETLLPPLPPRSALVKQARGLAALGDEEFLAVVNGVVDEKIGGLVGAASSDPKLQAAMIQVLKRAQPANEIQALGIIEQVKAQGLETRVTEDLFGEQAFAESLYLERAQVLDAAVKLARTDRVIFGGLVRNEERIAGAGGNRLDRSANVARQQEAADAAQQITVRANSKGSLSDALTDAARRVREGAKPGTVAQAFLAAARREILQGDPGGSAAGAVGRSSDPSRIVAAEVSLADVDARAVPDLAQLSRNPTDYVAPSSSSAMVRLADLAPGKVTTQESSDNAVKRFAAAAAGELKKRKPITVAVDEAGRLYVKDGNGTVSALRRMGITEVAAELDVPIGKPIDLQRVAAPQRPVVLELYKAKQGGQTVEDLYQVAEAHQATLVAAARQIAEELGEQVELRDPGVKVRATTENKITRKGYKNAGALTDVIRAGFVTSSPQIAAEVIERLSKTFEILDEGVSVTPLGYLDQKALVRFPDGRVAEVQLWDGSLLDAKQGGGHQLYDEARDMTAAEKSTAEGAARYDALVEASKDMYARGLAGATPEWRQVAMMAIPEDMRLRVQEALAGNGAGAGKGGAPGKVSKNADLVSSTPDSSTSKGSQRDQLDSPSLTKKDSTPPSSVGRLSTAGRPSQLKNLSAIDSPPRSIIHAADDPKSAQPTKSRTGTVEDADYDAVMSQYQDLLDDHGQLLKVTREADGVTTERPASAVIDELDTMEESLERIRLCSVPARSAA